MTPEPEVHPLVARAWEFKQRLDAIRAADPAVDWYPYDTLSNVMHLERLLEGSGHNLASFLGTALTADLGCADGDLAFFLESLGARVHAFDHPASNHNTMKGVKRLKERLGSRIEIHATDLDSRFTLPEPPYKVVFLLGALYHLKNPFHVLETLAGQTEYCVLSTKVARRLPTGEEIRHQPVAYLVDDDELNGDPSNFWIFSETGLRRLCRRAGFSVERLLTLGDTAASDPVRAGHDERAFCLLRTLRAVTYLDPYFGWHSAEDTGWRWTARRFGIRADLPAGTRTARLQLKLFFPQWLFEVWGALQLVCLSGPDQLGEFTLDSPGPQTVTVALPAGASAVDLVFELDHALPPDQNDRRERGIIISSATMECGIHPASAETPSME